MYSTLFGPQYYRPPQYPSTQTQVCERLIDDICPLLLGDEFDPSIYADRKQAVCQTPKKKDEKTIWYKLTETWGDKGKGKTSFQWYAFLTLIFFLWIVAICIELREIFCWVSMMVSFAPLISNEGPATSLQNMEIRVLRIPAFHWVFTMMILVLRTIVTTLLLFFGTWYLSLQENYSDLILNSLALIFVLDADNLIGRVALPMWRKNCIKNTKVISPSSPCPAAVNSCCKTIQSISQFVGPVCTLCVLFLAAILALIFSSTLPWTGNEAILERVELLVRELWA